MKIDERTRAGVPSRGNPILGVLGGLAGGLTGAAVWWACANYTGMKLGYVAWGVGVAAGFGVVLFGRMHGGVYPIIGAATAVIGILAGEYLIYRSATVDVTDERILRALKAEGYSMEQARSMLPEIKSRLRGMGVAEYFKSEFTHMEVLFIALALFSGWRIPGLEALFRKRGSPL